MIVSWKEIYILAGAAWMVAWVWLWQCDRRDEKRLAELIRFWQELDNDMAKIGCPPVDQDAIKQHIMEDVRQDLAGWASEVGSWQEPDPEALKQQLYEAVELEKLWERPSPIEPSAAQKARR